MEEKKKFLERAARFGIEMPELQKQKLQSRAERFGIETKESIDQKKLDRMRRFGLDIKNKTDASEQKQQRLINQTTSEDDAKMAARIARFGITETKPETVENKRT